ncbi:MAG: hypothetical protein H8E40_05905 [Chloroflexi bacterium]|nr:hypothetical protein [Chloroflexota bacterium]
MAKCSRCGKPVSFLSSMCDDCKKAVKDEQKAEQERLEREKAQKAQQVREAYRSYRTELILTRVQSLQQKLASGGKVYLYEDIYLAVDSKVVDETVAQEFSIGSLRQLGLDGWDIVAVIPRTLGVALTNVSLGSSSGQTWGAGVGGNVVGVHIVVRKEVSTQSRDISADFLKDYIERNLFDFLTEGEVQVLHRLLQQQTVK